MCQDQGQLQVFRFGTSEEMLGGCLRLYERMGNKAGENRLYWMDDSYYLTVLLPEEEVAAAKEILLEYGAVPCIQTGLPRYFPSTAAV